MLSFSFFVIHNSVGCGENNVSKLSGRQDVIDKLLKVLKLKIVSWGDDSALVQSSVQLNNDFASSFVVYDFEFVDVAYPKMRRKNGLTMLLHHSKELHNNLGNGS